MIGVEGQYVLTFNIGEFQDAIDQNNLASFKLIEEAGNVLPMFEVLFTTYNEHLVETLNEGNPLSVSIGKTTESMKEASLVILNSDKGRMGDGSFAVKITGFLDAMDYLTNRKVSSKKATSVDAIRDIATKYFNMDITCKSSDESFWLQQTITDRDFINHIWFHSWIEDSCPMVGITASGDFIMRDLKSLADKDTPDWRFVTTPQQEIDVTYCGGHTDVNPSGFMNRLGAYGKSMVVRDSTTGTFSNLVTEPLDPVLAQSANVDKQKKVDPRMSTMVEISENVHPHFWDAYNQNIATLASLSSSQICLKVVNEFHPFKLLDLCFYKEDRITMKKGDSKEATEHSSGYYIVTRIANVIKGNTLATFVNMTRETMNNIRGQDY